MREIRFDTIKDAVRELCLKANFEMRSDILKALRTSLRKETNDRAKRILKSIIENARIAKKKRLAICQDTGMGIGFLEIGQDVSFVGGSLKKAIDDGVREAYHKGCLRKSVVEDALLRNNTATNTPAVIYTDIVEGGRVNLEVSPKGFGSESKSAVKMLRPTASMEEIKGFILDIVKFAGPDACPPFILGVGIGGTFDTVTHLAKRALFRSIEQRNPKRHMANLERELFKEINTLGLGPMGLGGRTTVLGVNILDAPTHIAGLPVAVNISCHATRSASKII